jgi:hypothetical protein
MYADTVVPALSKSISFTGAVGGGTDGNGYWGFLSTFIWNENLGGKKDQGEFCSSDIDVFTPDLTGSASVGATDSISLTVANSQDNNATFSASYFVTYHDEAENIVTDSTLTVTHPVGPANVNNPEWQYSNEHDNDTSADQKQSATYSATYTDSVTAGASTSLGAEGVAEISGNVSVTNGHLDKYSITLDQTTPAYTKVQFFYATPWVEYHGTYDNYEATGYQGNFTWIAKKGSTTGVPTTKDITVGTYQPPK